MVEEEEEEESRKVEKKEGAVEKMKRLLRVDSDETDDLHDKYRWKKRLNQAFSLLIKSSEPSF